ncbi:hypothetical protein PICSAR164_02549 [Mycobacterium avium subsp. paratuberculosis]|nr:hypothetical protein PICSAR164_02549 [Mycobacterium avium subsp. paratuberculosis]CAG7192591.1 hypothetical protein PICSAR235_03228 [Mycobacterium avium subsp. paratuberculosis]CAG7197279.1 hypothetical protein PICSAR249_03656 [Mycobacterium avium subsp. paratuberculosis]CAG7243846.1 hypothetical protein PICSAR28_03359 [Mycobacterium avium subsp. paratuberculosis]CAG7318618.1 hypothetical protein PICSAR65_01979 [Mycobacterium avium subsp. paratuberculosis]
MKGLAVAGDSFEDHHLGGQCRVVGLDHRRPPGRPPVRVVGHAGRRRRVVQCEDLGAQLAAGQLAAQPHPALRLARAGGGLPVDTHRRLFGDENVGVVRPFVDGEVQPVEMRPPEGFVLAPVVAAGRRQQRHCGLLRGALVDAGGPGERRQRGRQLVAVVDGVAVAHRLRTDGQHAGFVGAQHQPVTQLLRGPAVVVVVVLDLLEHRDRLVGAAVGLQFAVARVGGDRPGGRGHLPGAQPAAHVQRLERLEAERVRAHPNAPAHQGIQVDQCPAAQQFVDLVLAHPVAAGQPQQRGLLVRRVMVDVHVGAAPAPVGHQRQKVGERLAFLGPVVRPQRPEPARRPGFEDPEQVFQTPFAAVGGPQRVAFEVEEQITGVGLGQQRQRLRIDDLDLRHPGFTFADLQFGLGGQFRDHPGGQLRHRPAVRGQFGNGADAGVKKLVPLADSHAGDQQHIVGGAQLLDAHRAAEARGHVLVVPAHRGAAGAVFVEQPLQPGPG